MILLPLFFFTVKFVIYEMTKFMIVRVNLNQFKFIILLEIENIQKDSQ